MIYGCGGERMLYIMRNRAEYSQSRFRSLDKLNNGLSTHGTDR